MPSSTTVVLPLPVKWPVGPVRTVDPDLGLLGLLVEPVVDLGHVIDAGGGRSSKKTPQPPISTPLYQSSRLVMCQTADTPV